MPLTIVICGGSIPKPIIAVRDSDIIDKVTQLLVQRLMADEDADALDDEVLTGEVRSGDDPE
jgi:hypothetical protein